MTCTQCGGALIAGRKFCGQCGSPVPAETVAPGYGAGTFVPATAPATATMPRPASAVPTTAYPAGPRSTRHELNLEKDLEVRLAHGEVVKGTYDIAGFTKRFGSMRGRLVVTDARVLYKARAHNILNESSLDEEIQLQDVSGLSLAADRGLRPAAVAALLVLASGTAFLELLMLVTIARYSFPQFLVMGFLLFVLAAVIGLVIYLSGRMEGVAFRIQTRAAGGTPITLSGGRPAKFSLLSLLGLPLMPLLDWLGIDHASASDWDASYTATREMFDELGALILDLQSRGVLGEAGR